MSGIEVASGELVEGIGKSAMVSGAAIDAPAMLPCPFCGRTEFLAFVDTCIHCGGCGANGPDFHQTKESAAVAWNTRRIAHEHMANKVGADDGLD